MMDFNVIDVIFKEKDDIRKKLNNFVMGLVPKYKEKYSTCKNDFNMDQVTFKFHDDIEEYLLMGKDVSDVVQGFTSHYNGLTNEGITISQVNRYIAVEVLDGLNEYGILD